MGNNNVINIPSIDEKNKLNNKDLIIIIAEDDDGHTELIKEGLIDSGVHNRIIRFSNGEEVWDFISGKSNGEVFDKNKAYLLLLDINMPKMDKIEFFKKN